MLKKLLITAVVIVAILWIVSQPAVAGSTVHGWITGLMTFFKHLTSG